MSEYVTFYYIRRKNLIRDVRGVHQKEYWSRDTARSFFHPVKDLRWLKKYNSRAEAEQEMVTVMHDNVRTHWMYRVKPQVIKADILAEFEFPPLDPSKQDIINSHDGYH